MKFARLSLLLLSSHLAFAEGPIEDGTVTLPLKTVMSVLKEPTQKPETKPPTQAVIHRSTLAGNLTRDALVLKAHFEVTVLTDTEGWAKLPLLEMGPHMYVTQSTDTKDAVVATVDGQLCFMSKTAGQYAFDVELMVRAKKENALRTVTLKASPQTPLVPITVSVLPSFTLLDPSTNGDLILVFPINREWRLTWKSQSERSKETMPSARVPIEKKVISSKAEWVTTLEGKLNSRIVYELQLDGPEEIELSLPEKHVLTRILVNGVVQKLPSAEGKLKIPVFPKELGSSQGSLEVIIARELGVFHLSGEFTLHLPTLSWPIAEVMARAHLPAVFQYVRQGGSLEAHDVSTDAQDSTYPGTLLQFRQYLVQGSAPDVELSYSVNLENKYFQRKYFQRNRAEEESK